MTALAQNQARGRAAKLAGPPLGGALLGLARVAPFVADAVSYAVSLATVTAVRGPLGNRRSGVRGHLLGEIREGLHQVLFDPFRRALMVIGALVNSGYAGLELAMIVALRLHGWSSTTIGIVRSCSARTYRRVEIAPLDEGPHGVLACPAGSARSDAVEASVVLCARDRGHAVITTDDLGVITV